MKELAPVDAIGDDDDRFFAVPHLKAAGLWTDDAETEMASPAQKLFYHRPEVTRIWEAIDHLPPQKSVFFQGQPGIGKTTAVWRKCIDVARSRDGTTILWVSLDRQGQPVRTVFLRGNHFCDYFMTFDILEAFIYTYANYGDEEKALSIDTTVVDNASSSAPASVQLEILVNNWVRVPGLTPTARAIFIASTKVEQLRSHQNNLVKYRVVHSWTLEDFCNALIIDDERNDGAKAPPLTEIYKVCAKPFP